MVGYTIKSENDDISFPDLTSQSQDKKLPGVGGLIIWTASIALNFMITK